MAEVTEIVTFPIKDGTTPLDESTPSGKAFQKVFETISQAEGFQTLAYGLGREEPSLVHGAIDWKSLDAHKAFQQHESYKTLVANLKEIMGGELKILHITWDNPPAKQTLAAPITEYAIFYLSGNATDADKEKYAKNAQEFLKVLEGHAAGFVHAVGGWAVEQPEYNGEKSHVFVSLLGWESYDAHMKFRETQHFKDNIHLLREGSVGAQMSHFIVEQGAQGELNPLRVN